MSLWQHADGSRGVAATQREQVWPWNADATSFSVTLEVGHPIAVKRLSLRRRQGRNSRFRGPVGGDEQLPGRLTGLGGPGADRLDELELEVGSEELCDVLRLGPVAWAVGLGAGTALVYPTLIAAISDAVSPVARAPTVGVYRFWRDMGYVVGGLIAGFVADALGYGGAIAIVAAVTAASGLWVAADMPGPLGQGVRRRARTVGDETEWGRPVSLPIEKDVGGS